MTTMMYLFKKNSSDGEELKYSLRSIQQNFVGDIKPVVIGDKPTWYIGDHIASSNQPGAKYRNILRNTLVGLHALYSEGTVYYSDDDYFLMDPVSSVELAYWGPLDEHVADVVKYHGDEHAYSKHMKSTQAYIDSAAAQSFELHRPMPVRTDLAYHALLKAWEQQDPIPFWRTVYGNVALNEGISCFKVNDGRVDSPGRDGVPWLSTSDNHWRGRWGQTIRETFTTPSRWEA